MLYKNPFQISASTQLKTLESHPTKRSATTKFFFLLIIISVYTATLAWQYGWKDGGMLSIVTWSFFVLCTPIADAGFLLDFPIRIFFKVRMILSEAVVWMIAISINLVLHFYHPDLYQQILVTRLLNKIITHPYPFWGIIILSAMGTFLSVQFGDELIDLIHDKDRKFYDHHKRKHHLIIIIFLMIVVMGVYGGLLSELGVSIPSS